MCRASTTNPTKKTPYIDRLALVSNGTVVIIHDTFIEKKKIKIDFNTVKPLVTIFT